MNGIDEENMKMKSDMTEGQNTQTENHQLLMEQTVSWLKSENAALNEKLEELKKENAALNEKLDESKKENAALNEKLELAESENAALNEKLEQYYKKYVKLYERLNRLDSEKDRLMESVDRLDNRSIELMEKVQRLDDENAKLYERLQQLGLDQTADFHREIRLERSSLNQNMIEIQQWKEKRQNIQPYIPDDVETVPPLFEAGGCVEDLKNLLDVSNIRNYLKKSDYKKAGLYLGRLNTYEEKLRESFANLNADEGELTSVCVDMIAGCFDQYLAAAVMEGALERIKEDRRFYTGLLKNIYQYLNTNHIYSKKINAGDSYQDMPDMNIVPKKTEDPSMHDQIEQILNLPFYIRYVNDHGKIEEKLLHKGTCVVLTAD